MKLINFFLGAALLAGPSTTALAQDTTTPPSDPVMDIIVERLSRDLTHHQIAVLNLLAHATAAAELCDDIQLKESAVYGALAASTHDASDDLTPEQKQRHHDLALIGFGGLAGLMMQEAVGDRATFCEQAKADASDPETQSFIDVVKSPETK